MRSSLAKSSITLPPEEFATILKLKKQLACKSNVEVVRRGLTLLREHHERQELQRAYQHAAARLRSQTKKSLRLFDTVDIEHL